MSELRFDSVWDAIEDSPAEAENMRLRSALMVALRAHIARAGLTQGQAAKLFGVTQPRVSDLMRGKIGVFGLDGLVNMAAAAGLRVEMRVGEVVNLAIEDVRVLGLSGEDCRAVVEAVLDPPAPTPALRRAAEAHRQLIAGGKA